MQAEARKHMHARQHRKVHALQCRTVRVDTSQYVCSYHSSHDHHDGHNEVGHEGDEHEDKVGTSAPTALYNLQESVRLQHKQCKEVATKWV